MVFCFFVLFFLKKNIGKVFLVIFKKIQPNFLQLWLKWLILHDFSKLKKKILPKWKILILTPVKQGFFFFAALERQNDKYT